MTTITTTLQDLKRQYKDAIEYLDSNFAFFLTHILNIGSPEWTNQVPTAAVTLSKDIKDLSKTRFVFNSQFAETLDTNKFAFVLAHETMHVLLHHLRLMRKFKYPLVFNIAADCVINDYLIDMGLDEPEGIMRGEANVGYNCANSTVSQVYNDLLREIQKQQQDPNSCQGQGEQIDDHGWMQNPEQFSQGNGDATRKELEKSMEELAKQAEAQTPADVDRKRQDDNYKSKIAGYGVAGIESFMENKNVSLMWAKLLEEVNPDIFKRFGPRPRPSWHAPRRKLMGFYPDVVLPITRKQDEGKGEQPAIVMALDTSGSIGQEQANQFVNMARSIPQDKVKLYACTFTTEYQHLDLENPSWNSGGTCFSCIEGFVQKEVMPDLGHYPKAVVVVTDGYATFRNLAPDDEHGKNWLWLITHGGTTGYGGGAMPGRTEELTKYAKGL